MGNICGGNFDPPRPSDESNSKKKKGDALLAQPMRHQSGSQSNTSDNRVAAEKLYQKSPAPSSSSSSSSTGKNKHGRLHGSSTTNTNKNRRSQHVVIDRLNLWDFQELVEARNPPLDMSPPLPSHPHLRLLGVYIPTSNLLSN